MTYKLLIFVMVILCTSQTITAQTNADKIKAWHDDYQRRMAIEAWASGQGNLPKGGTVIHLSLEEAEEILRKEGNLSEDEITYGKLEVKLPRKLYPKLEGKIKKGKNKKKGSITYRWKYQSGTIFDSLKLNAYNNKDDKKYYHCWVYAPNPEKKGDTYLLESFGALKGKTALKYYGETQKVVEDDDYVIQGQYRKYNPNQTINIVANDITFGFGEKDVWFYNSDGTINKKLSGYYEQGIRIKYPSKSDVREMESKYNEY